MTATAAISKALLNGEVLTIKTAFELFGITNLPREIGRSIERKFNVKVSRNLKEGRSRYNVYCRWYEYRLNKTKYNEEGIKRMESYILKHSKNFV